MPKDENKESKEKRQKRHEERQARRPNRKDVPDDATLKILVDKNPRREGTQPHAHFEKYQDGMTVGDLLSESIGGEWVHLQADVERGYVDIVKS